MRWPVAVALLCLLSVPMATLEADERLTLQQRDGLVDLRANNAPVSLVAEALAQEFGIKVVVTSGEQSRLTAEFEGEPLDRALALISPNHMLIRDSAAADAPIVEVVMMLDDSGSDMSTTASPGEFLPSGEPTAEIVTGTDPGAAGTGDTQARIGEQAEKVGQQMRELIRQQRQSGSEPLEPAPGEPSPADPSQVDPSQIEPAPVDPSLGDPGQLDPSQLDTRQLESISPNAITPNEQVLNPPPNGYRGDLPQ